MYGSTSSQKHGKRWVSGGGASIYMYVYLFIYLYMHTYAYILKQGATPRAPCIQLSTFYLQPSTFSLRPFTFQLGLSTLHLFQSMFNLLPSTFHSLQVTCQIGRKSIVVDVQLDLELLASPVRKRPARQSKPTPESTKN